MKKILLILMLCLWAFSCDDLEITNPLHPDFDTKLNIDKSTQIVVPYTKGSFTINVTSNVDWTVSSSDSWLTYSPDNGSSDGTVTIYYSANPETAERSGTISITGNGVTRTCTITQSEFVPELTIIPATKQIGFSSGSFTIDVTSNVDWTVSSSDSWLTYSTNNGSNDGTVTINYTENTEMAERRGTITIIGGGITQSCSIQQAGLYEMILISDGTFEMGSNDGDSDELPIHTVTVSDFYIGKYEVTQELYQKVMGTNPSYFSGDNLPVESVTWYEAVEFCNALSQKAGLTLAYTISGTTVTWNQNANGYRLPTEAEWEYAAGGGASNRTKYAGTNYESSLGNYAWYSSNSGSETHSVGTKEPNSLGLYDMSGNVWEWCWDWYDSDYYSSSPSTNPSGLSSGSDRVLRGGSWYYGATYCRVADRNRSNPSYWNRVDGFRILRNAE